MADKFARTMRHNATEAEHRLWLMLRNRQLGGFKFRRQHPIGEYIVDFACIERRQVVEADGSGHVESTPDADRTAWLACEGWRVIRFWNPDILRTPDMVRDAIWYALHWEDQAERSTADSGRRKLPHLPHPVR